jgi:hypothetical protein
MAAAALFLAWMTAEIIALLGISEYLAGLINNGPYYLCCRISCSSWPVSSIS